MAGKSPVVVSDEQRAGLADLSQSRDRAEADRVRAVLLTLSGWTSGRIAEAFGVREDTVRLWRGAFMRGGVGPGVAGDAGMLIASSARVKRISPLSPKCAHDP